jgi:phosphate transport system substrate-binding protein
MLDSKAQYRCKIMLLALALGFGLYSPTVRTAEVIAGGTGAGIGLMQALAEEHAKSAPGIKFKMLPGLGSSGGIRALVAGKVHIALSARPLTDAERRAGLVAHEIARTPLVIAVNHRNTTIKLTLDELAALYAGRTVHWADGTPARPVLRTAEDTDTITLKTFSPAVAQAASAALLREGMLIATTDSDSADALESVPGAFGTMALSTLIAEKRALKPLTVGGHEPSVKALADNRYPWHKTLYIVTAPDTPPAVAEFLKFVSTHAARAVLAANGSLPGK